MGTKWTREAIIRQILEREARGLPLALGKQGVGMALYQAGARVFGSWRNAVQAAGIPPERAIRSAKWTPAKILAVIRNLARLRQPMSEAELAHRYGSILPAAQRLFGSWSKAVMAAGVDPTHLRRVVPWTRERVIEAILTRALRNEPLGVRTTEPRSLVDAGQRFYGSWAAAVSAAGLDPKAIGLRPVLSAGGAVEPPFTADLVHRPRQPGSREAIITGIRDRLRQQKPLNAYAMSMESRGLYRAATRRFGGWREALLAAGLNPDEHQRGPGRRGRLASDVPNEDTRQPHLAHAM